MNQNPEKETVKKSNKFVDFFKRLKGNVSGGVFFTLAILSIAILLIITIFIIAESIPFFKEVNLFKFLFGMTWDPVRPVIEGVEDSGPQFGILPMLIGTLTVTLGAIIIGVPIAIATAIFMSEYAPAKVRNAFRPGIQLLAGIPSVVYGFVGLLIVAFIRNFIGGSGYSMLAGAIVLAIMILPTVISISEVALTSLPRQYKEGALALGMTQWQAIWRVQFPAAKSGIIASVILGIGRAVGETMAVIMVLGNAPALPGGLLSSVRTLTTNIGLEFGYAEGLHSNALFATGLVLFAIIMIINSIAGSLVREKASGIKKKGIFQKAYGAIKKLFKKEAPAPQKRPVKKVKLYAKRLTVKKTTPAAAQCTAQAPSPAVAAPVATESEPLHDPPSPAPETKIKAESKKPLISPKATGNIAKGVIWAMSALVMLILISIIVYLLVKGLPQLNGQFFKNVGPTVVGTLFVTFIAIIIAIPLGVGAAFFLAEYTSDNFFTRVIRFSVESLAGIPSIIYGLFGFIFFVINLGMRWSVLAGGLTLAIMVLPTIIRTTEEAIKSVPQSFRETSYSLGASKWQTIYKVVFPSAMRGIVNGIILSIGRCVAETAAIMLTLGSALKLPTSLFDSSRTMATHFYLLVMEDVNFDEAFGTAILLILSILLINIVANALVNRFVARGTTAAKAKNKK